MDKKFIVFLIFSVFLMTISAACATDNITIDDVGVEMSEDTVLNIEGHGEDEVFQENVEDISEINDNSSVVGISDSGAVRSDDSEEVICYEELLYKSYNDSFEIKQQQIVSENGFVAKKVAENKDIVSVNLNKNDSKLSIYSNANVYIKSLKTYYNSGKYLYFGWNGYFDGYFKVYKGYSLYYKEYLYGYNRNLKWSLTGLPAGRYVVKMADYSGATLGKGKIIIKKSTSKIRVNSFSARSGSVFYCYSYVKDKYNGRSYDGGTVKYYIGGKVYRAKLKNGVAVAKIKIPSKARKYICKATFLGGHNVYGKSTHFKIKVKPKYRVITTYAKKYYIYKRSGKYRVETKIWEMWRPYTGNYKYIDVFLYKNGKLVPNYKYLTKYRIYGKWTKWLKLDTGTSHHRYVAFYSNLNFAKVQVKFLND